MRYLEPLIVFVLSIFILLLSFYPIYHRAQITPEGRDYAGTTYFTEDYAGYVSVIEQGIKGRWSATDKFTNEKTPGTYQYYPYLLLGHLAEKLNLTSVQTYHLSRFIFGLIYLMVIYYFVRCNIGLPFKRIIAFILVALSSSFPVLSQGTLDVPVISRIVAEVQVVNRFVIQPHYLLGNMALIFCLAMLLEFLKKPRFRYLFFSGALVLSVTFFRPVNILLFLSATGGYWLFLLLKNREINGKLLVFLMVNAVMFLPGFWYLNNLKLTYPELPYFQFDLVKDRLFGISDWILLQGPVFVFAIFSLWKIKKGESEKIILLLIFVLVNFCLTFILPEFYDLNPIRTIQTPLFAVLGILAAFGIFKISRNIIVLIIITIITVSISLPTLILDFNHEVNLYVDAYYIWPPKGYLPALKELGSKGSDLDVVLTYHSLSNLTPMYSGNTVFWGHTNETINYDAKKKLVESFYQGAMNPIQAQRFLLGNNIKYVLLGREEKDLGTLPKYVFLNKIISNGDIDIYKIE